MSGVRLALLGLAAGTLAAQNLGRFTGRVEDPAGAAVPGAAVGLSLPRSQAKLYVTQTSEQGYFALTGIQAGEYDVHIQSPGFQNKLISNLKIDPGRELSIPRIALEIGAVTETVNVTADAATVQTANAEVATTVTAGQVRNLPALDRQVINLIKTQPGVNTGRGPTSINGLRTSTANVTLDGINIQDNYFRRNSLDFMPNRPTVDQMAEFTITTSNSAATVGGGVAQVAMVTPSGSNDFHGTLLWANRNNSFAANNWFNNRNGLANPFLNQNQWGGYIGGPVLRNKLFFYSGYERLDARRQRVANRRILTNPARGGVFTYGTAAAPRQVNILQLLGVTADPIMQSMMANVPDGGRANNFDLGDSLPGFNRNTAGYAFNMRANNTRDNVTARADYYVSTKHTISGTYLWNNEFVDRGDAQDDSAANLNGYGVTPGMFTDANRNLVSLTWRWNPASRFTNEARGGFNLAPTAFRIPGDLAEYWVLFPLYSNPAVNQGNQGRSNNTFHYSDNATYVQGRHTLLFGFNMHQLRAGPYDNFVVPSFRIGLGLSRGLTQAELPGASAQDLVNANTLLATLAGYIDQAAQTFNIRDRSSGFVPRYPQIRNMRAMDYALYFQDNWKARKGLTLTLGVRWEPFMPVDERDSLYLLPTLVDGNPLRSLGGNNTLDFAGKSAGRPWYSRDMNNFAPNIGLAWDPFGDGKTSFRAGYMVSFVNDNQVRTVQNNVGTNSGLQQTVRLGGLATTMSRRPTIAPPAFRVPTTFAERYALDRTNAVGLPDPGLVTPYVQQWTAGIQRELGGNVLEVRYVANKATKLMRGIDFNQIDIRANGYLDDFLRAFNNGNLARTATGVFNPNHNPAIAGSQPTPLLAALPNSGSMNNAFFRGLIERGEAGAYFNNLQINGLNGNVSFYRNPVALGTNMLTNYSNSNYHSLQVDVQRRMKHGLQIQANYVYGKVLSDSGSETDEQFEALLDINSPRIERARATFDLTHAFKMNGVWQVPLRRPSSRLARALMHGWMMSGNLTWQSGQPFSVFSQRGTLNRDGRSNVNTANTTLNKKQLDEFFRFRMTGSGPMFVPESGRNPLDGRPVAVDGAAPFQGQVFFHPGPGQLGQTQRRMFSGPSAFNLDAAVLKNIEIREGQTVMLRMEAFNMTNHPTFAIADQTLANTNFGRLTGLFYDRRILQFGLQYRF
ncbi:MAG: hypothetical protein FJW40_23125 [Acidobacteria bacterium]|nr:hypothetical protein [Acidobacteriota bacterium]